MIDDTAPDSDDLEALFDSIVAANAAETHAIPERTSAIAVSEDGTEKVINQIGLMVRTLHDELCKLGLNQEIVKAASFIPDARDRLNYVTTLTQQAADRVLNAIEAAQPVMEKTGAEAHRLSARWQLLFENKLDVEQFKNLATQTHAFLYEVPKQVKITNAFLMEIMMAQDFQDLTGQVIRKILDVTQNMEHQLLSLLLEHAQVLRPGSVHASMKTESKSDLMTGPVISPNGSTDVVNSQDQVDLLLENLGF